MGGHGADRETGEAVEGAGGAEYLEVGVAAGAGVAGGALVAEGGAVAAGEY